MMKTILKGAAVYTLGRAAMRRLRKLDRQRRANRRRSAAMRTVVVLGAGTAAYFVAREVWLRRQERPSQTWPSRKKIERDEKAREARLRATEEANRPPPEIRLERNATTELKATLGDVARPPRGNS
jgi:hypothetical protein